MATETYVTSGGKPTINKDPDATLDYSFDWTPWLKGVSDSIENASFTFDETLTKTREAFDDMTATVWLSGGIAGNTPLRVTCRIVTMGGRTDERSIFLKIVER